MQWSFCCFYFSTSTEISNTINYHSHAFEILNCLIYLRFKENFKWHLFTTNFGTITTHYLQAFRNNCIHLKLKSALLEHFGYVFFSLLSLLSSTEKSIETSWKVSVPKCHQVVQLRVRSIMRSVIFWLSFDFGTVKPISSVVMENLHNI